MVLLDETGGKPLTGYGSGANSGSPIATAEETAAMEAALAITLAADFNRMCQNGGAYDFGGAFCQSVAVEGRDARHRADLVLNRGEWGDIVERYVGTCMVAAVQGAVITSGGGVTAVGGAAAGCATAVIAKSFKSKGKGTTSYAVGQVMDQVSAARAIRNALVKGVGGEVPSLREIIRMYRETMRTQSRPSSIKTWR